MSKKSAIAAAQKTLAQRSNLPLTPGVKPSVTAATQEQLKAAGVKLSPSAVSPAEGVVLGAGGTGSATGAVPTEYQSPELVLKIDGLKEKIRAVLLATGEVASKYFDLCIYIRKTPGLNDAPKIVSRELQGMGFKRSRISEIKRVAFAADDVFASYEAKKIGFDKALELARVTKPGGRAVATPAGQLLIGAGSLTIEEGDEIVNAESQPSGHATGVKTDGEKIKAFAKSICRIAQESATFKKAATYRFDDYAGWLVNVRPI